MARARWVRMRSRVVLDRGEMWCAFGAHSGAALSSRAAAPTISLVARRALFTARTHGLHGRADGSR